MCREREREREKEREGEREREEDREREGEREISRNEPIFTVQLYVDARFIAPDTSWHLCYAM